MENEATTKTPIPTRPGFRNFAICTCLHPDPLGLIFAFSISRPSTLVEPPLQIALFFAKQSQFPQGQNQCNLLCQKELHQYCAPLRPQKTNPNKPNFKIGKMTISTAIIKAYANQQRTMTNERLFKTNPIEPNSPARNPFFRSKTKVPARKSNFSAPSRLGLRCIQKNTSPDCVAAMGLLPPDGSPDAHTPESSDASGNANAKTSAKSETRFVSPTFAVGWPNRDFKNIFPA